MSDVIDSYRDAGYSSNFSVGEHGTVRCEACCSSLDGGRLPMHSLRRLEGASDPADMVAVVATSCPVCGADGTLVMGYGPMASPDDADVLAVLPDLRGREALPGDSPPDEVPHQRSGT